MQQARVRVKKVVFLLTDGYSNFADPVPAALTLQDEGVEIFTFGIERGNITELRAISSYPSVTHCYIVDSFDEFVALARRALHAGKNTVNNFNISGHIFLGKRLCMICLKKDLIKKSAYYKLCVVITSLKYTSIVHDNVYLLENSSSYLFLFCDVGFYIFRSPFDKVKKNTALSTTSIK